MNTRKEKLLIPAIAFMMILLFSVLCAAGAFALSSTAKKEDSFERLDYADESLVTGSIGTLQEAALRRLNAANEEDGGKLTLFSDAQLAKFKAARENGTLEPLSLEDIRFLINDSIVLYNKYDGIVIKRLQDAAPSEEDEVIVPYHGDFKELKESEQKKKYESMEMDVFKIIQYRLSVLDGGYQAYKMYSDPAATLEDYCLEIDNVRMCTIFEKDGRKTVRFLDDLRCFNDEFMKENGFIHGNAAVTGEEAEALIARLDAKKYGLGVRCFAPEAQTDREAAFSEYEVYRSMEWSGIFTNEEKPTGNILLFNREKAWDLIKLVDPDGNVTTLFPCSAMRQLLPDDWVDCVPENTL